METNHNKLLDALAKGAESGAKFAKFVYMNKAGEVAEHLVILHYDAEKVYQSDAAVLQEMLDTLTGIDHEAAVALFESRAESVIGGIGNNSEYTCAGVYEEVPGLRGVKVHKEQNVVHIMGLCESKEVLIPGEYKEVKSRPLTIAKDKIRKQLSSSRIRQYKITNVLEARINGEVLEFVCQ